MGRSPGSIKSNTPCICWSIKSAAIVASCSHVFHSHRRRRVKIKFATATGLWGCAVLASAGCARARSRRRALAASNVTSASALAIFISVFHESPPRAACTCPAVPWARTWRCSRERSVAMASVGRARSMSAAATLFASATDKGLRRQAARQHRKAPELSPLSNTTDPSADKRSPSAPPQVWNALLIFPIISPGCPSSPRASRRSASSLAAHCPPPEPPGARTSVDAAAVTSSTATRALEDGRLCANRPCWRHRLHEAPLMP